MQRTLKYRSVAQLFAIHPEPSVVRRAFGNGRFSIGASDLTLSTAAFARMAESFGTEFTIVEVTSDQVPEPTRQMWVALAKPDQALTLVLASVPEGWTAQILTVLLTESDQRTLKEVKLNPGEVYKLTRE